MSLDLLTFADALAEADEIASTKHVLLGNGFSRACRDGLFSYDALKNQADFSRLSIDAWAAFDALGTSDFEAVMRALRQTAVLMSVYDADRELVDRIQRDADALKDILVEAVAVSHPDHPFEISEEEYIACRRFLRPFNRIYSLNYDLLLYWAAMRTELEPSLQFDDGFRAPDEADTEYVIWEPAGAGSQNVYYLHGALHIFDGGSETRKYTWNRTGVRLVDQIRAAMDNNLFPVFVSEGESEAKLTRIRHNGYLSRGERSLVSIRGSLFTFGYGFSANDAHVLRFIDSSRINAVFVSLFGDPDSEENQKIRARANGLKEGRSNPESLTVRFYDAESAAVWG